MVSVGVGGGGVGDGSDGGDGVVESRGDRCIFVGIGS